MPNFEAIAGVDAAARFLLEEGMDSLARFEADVFAHLWDGLGAINGVRRIGPTNPVLRAPTAAFVVDGVAPSTVSARLAEQKIAVWDGHAYAVEVVNHLGLADSGGVVRAGIVRYIENGDVERLLSAIAAIARRG
jgi:selenocysteine lyase/cysteine desulfurase